MYASSGPELTLKGCALGGDQAEKSLDAYDEDATLSIDYLVGLKNCTGRVATTGMCLGGHLVRLLLVISPRCPLHSAFL